MKKTIAVIATATMCSSVAQAQSTVTVYGSIDNSLRDQTNTNASGGHSLTLSSGNYFADRWGFKGMEYLGGGFNAHFNIENGFNASTGAGYAPGFLFNFQSMAGLGGAFGKLDVGRLYAVPFRVVKLYDPFNYAYYGIIPISAALGTSLPASAAAAGLDVSATNGTRLSNDIQYTGEFGPLTVLTEYAPGGVAGNERAGSVESLGFKYVAGAFGAGAAYTQKTTVAGFGNNEYTMGCAYAWNDVRVSAGYAKDVQQTATSADYASRQYWSGASYKLTPAWSMAAAFYHTDVVMNTAATGTRNLDIVGVTYAFSAQTNLYAEVDVDHYKGVLVPIPNQGTQSGISFGVNHLF